MLVLDLVQDIKDNKILGDVNFGLHTTRRCGSSMYVYRPQDTYVMGWICYADHRSIKNPRYSDERYSVFSPNIQNRKYADNGEREHMSSTLYKAKGVKNAMKHLRPLTALQVLHQTKSEFYDKLVKVRDVATLAYHKAAEPVRQTPFPSNTYLMERPNAIQDELQAMINSGHKFINKELEAELRVAFSALDELTDSRKLTSRKHTFVEAYTVGGDTRFRGFPNVSNHVTLYGIDESTAFDYAQEELPESIVGGISVLSMVQVGHYVAGVGIKHADNMFYLSEE
jgi:hypothetical protein